MEKFFPIRTDTACQLKWNWSTLYLHGGKTASCHRTGWSDINTDSFENFHNTEKKQAERLKMLQGQWPEDSCQYCRDIEQSGGYSDRLLHLDIPDMSPRELESDPTATEVTPTILEVFFDNTCNMACIYCIPNLSSRINQENAKFGNWYYKDIALESLSQDTDYDKMLSKFWSWMGKNSLNLKRFNVLGGEPFYQKEYYKLLDYFEKNPHPNLELGVVSNLMISTEKIDEMIDRWKSLIAKKHLRRVDLTCSIDCWGPEQTYVRYGLDLDMWQANFERLLQHRWLKININQTISVLTIKTIPDLLNKLKTWRSKHKIGQYFSETSPQPSYLMPNILGSVFEEDFKTIIDLMPRDNEQDEKAIEYMSGIAGRIAKSNRNHGEIDKLKHFLDEKDRRRNTNWKETFPWLVKEIDHVV